MKRIVLLSLILISLFSFVIAQDGPSTLIGEYFLDSGKSISVLGKTVGVGTVRSNGEVYVYINSYGRYIYPGKGFIEYEGLIVEPLETFYDSSDPKGHAASIAVYSTLTKIECGDSDGGSEYNVRGTVTIKDREKREKSYTDYCQNENAVQEFTCLFSSEHTTVDNAYAVEYRSCPYGCKDGRCVSDNGPSGGSCSDTDNTYAITTDEGGKYNPPGKDRYTKGIVTYNSNVYQDFCVNRVEYNDDIGNQLLRYDKIFAGTHIIEIACIDGNRYYETTPFECPNGCRDGACVLEEVDSDEKTAQELDSGKYFFEVNSKIELFDKKIKLLDVYEDGTAVVQVGETTVIIFPQKSRQIYTTKGQFSGSFIDIRNEESFYSSKKEDRAVTLDISFGMYIEERGSESPQEFAKDDLEEQLIRCNGCLDSNDNCIPISVRVGDLYCDIDKNFKDQLGENALCNNNYECSSNLCIDNQCIEPGLFQKILSWFKRLFG